MSYAAGLYRLSPFVSFLFLPWMLSSSSYPPHRAHRRRRSWHWRAPTNRTYAFGVPSEWPRTDLVRSLALALLSLSRVDASSLPSSSRPSLPLPPPFHCFARCSAPTPSGLESTTRLLFSFPQWHERSSAAHATRAAFSSWPIPPVPISCLLLLLL